MLVTERDIKCEVFCIRLHQEISLLDNLEDELEEGAEYLAALLQFEAHVEALHVGEVLQEVEVALERGVLEEEIKQAMTLH